jgi:(p)ppGpp synthase/HD superfamily hydrolase
MIMNFDEANIEKEVKAYARNAHLNQTRKFGADKGRSYFDTHITRVAERVSKSGGNFDQIIAAWLHDTKEDQPKYFFEEVLKTMGVTDNALDIVDHLSKLEGENYLDFTLRVMKKPEAILVKMKDIEDNMSDLKEGSMKDKYRLAHHMLKSELNSSDWVDWSQKNGND